MIVKLTEINILVLRLVVIILILRFQARNLVVGDMVTMVIWFLVLVGILRPDFVGLVIIRSVIPGLRTLLLGLCVVRLLMFDHSRFFFVKINTLKFD